MVYGFLSFLVKHRPLLQIIKVSVYEIFFNLNCYISMILFYIRTKIMGPSSHSEALGNCLNDLIY
jgi:hypothetical protein